MTKFFTPSRASPGMPSHSEGYLERTPKEREEGPSRSRALPKFAAGDELQIDCLAERCDPLVHSLLPRVLIDPHGEGRVRMTGDGRHD
jgi:hypothetical protein